MKPERVKAAQDYLFGGDAFKKARVRKSTKEQQVADNPVNEQAQKEREKVAKQEERMGLGGRLTTG